MIDSLRAFVVTPMPGTQLEALCAGPVLQAGAVANDMSRTDAKTAAVISIIERLGHPSRALVVGCGDGREAGVLARHFGAETIGVDIEDDFVEADSAPARLQVMDAQHLDFADGSFDLVYSFHALEHISDPRQAVREIHRVLAPGGAFVIGTPNKSRLVGYINSDAPVRDRIRWNVADLRARAAGRWSNEAGAHAGFTAGELMRLCATIGPVTDVAHAYYSALYSSRRRLIDGMVQLRVARLLFPAVYMAGRRSQEATRDGSPAGWNSPHGAAPS
ncbi:bifunctional 2-polyprenyl-6-hydroxyphenol methylase/3-demethylubiquinol 3-O-methyltransferase UbiG [Blastococcus sp. URHD0036]|uniref:class I SAM-dependent methyltransferase n=1 Tax=Blastococcus sp. URHD0036 TaxID=1380356 RepID=UPI00068C13F8|nr:class I SAM-dependent methyltransferase [Blastococcus sp. URHD0036]